MDACTCNPCECSLPPSPAQSKKSSAISKGGNDQVCTCNPCECSLPASPVLSKKGVVRKSGNGQACTCNPCECSPQESVPLITECTCDPCDCSVVTSAKGSLQKIPEECTCDPCECSLHPSKQSSVINTGLGRYVRRKCFALPANEGMKSCYQDFGYAKDADENFDEQEEDDPCKYRLRPGQRFSLPPTPVPSDHTIDNLNDLRKDFCRRAFPKNVGTPLNEDILIETLVKNPFGDFEMLLPGNQIYPGLLQSRIRDEDIPTIVNVLLEIRGITKVNLCYNEITDKGIETLSYALQECANIIEVDLMHNNITSDGILNMCKALMHRSPLHSLRLTGMKIGDKGMTALTCLILSGRGPYDLDVGECDLSVEGFQTLCSALHAMDHDIDYPSYLLLKNHLPMELVRLKESKAEYNAEVAHVTSLNRKVSQPTFIRVTHGGDGDVKLAPTNCTKVDQNGLKHLFETFSATILQGLFDLRHRTSEEDDLAAIDDVILNDPDYNPVSTGIGGSSNGRILNDIDSMIANFNKFREGPKNKEDIPNETENNAISGSGVEMSLSRKNTQLVPFDLYSLDIVDEEVLGGVISVTTDFQSERERTDSVPPDGETAEELSNPPDSYTAEAAATHVVREAIISASKQTAASEYKDGSDVTQLLLSSVLDTLGQIKIQKSQSQSSTNLGVKLTEDDCQRILEDAIEKIARLIFPKISSSACPLNPDDISCFLKVLFHISQGTFFQLFENAFFTQAVAETGSIACSQAIQRENENLVLGTRNAMQQGGMTESQVRQIAVSYLKGIFQESARIIGVARPFGIDVGNENASDSNNNNIQSVDLVSTEMNIAPIVDTLLEAAGAFAVATKTRARNMDETCVDFKNAADHFVVDLFENVNKMVVDTDLRQKVSEIENENSGDVVGPRTYAYVSRPTRLILNRPMFGPLQHAEIMARKLGDYMGENNSVCALHIQKWCLSEGGMMAFMENFRTNTTLVTLDMGCNQLGADGIALLGKYLSGNKNLKHLILNNNRIRDAGLAYLNEGIPGSSLVSLDIANNYITYRELDALLTTLPTTSIRALYMWGNKFGQDSWNILKILYDDGILTTSHTDVILQKVDNERVIVKNMQIRDMSNEYYEVPAIADRGLRLQPSFIDDSCKLRNQAPSTASA